MMELLEALNRRKAQYLVIGAHAVGIYAEPRGTKDLDIWVNPTKTNAKRVYAALKEFGAPLFVTTEETLINKEDFLIIGVAPNRIDILKSIPGLEFRACWKDRRTIEIGDTTVYVLSLDDLLTAKRAAGRPQDLVDAAKLEKALELEREQQQTSQPDSRAARPKAGRARRRRDGHGRRRNEDKADGG
jgi:hypothetical protein